MRKWHGNVERAPRRPPTTRVVLIRGPDARRNACCSPPGFVALGLLPRLARSTAPRADLMGPAPLSLCLARCVPASRACPLALLRGVVCCCVWYVVCLHCPVYARASCCRTLPACAVAIIVRFPSDGRVDKDQQSPDAARAETSSSDRWRYRSTRQSW